MLLWKSIKILVFFEVLLNGKFSSDETVPVARFFTKDNRLYYLEYGLLDNKDFYKYLVLSENENAE